MAQAERGLAELRGCVDTIITIPNSKLREVEEKITMLDAFDVPTTFCCRPFRALPI